MNEGSARSDCAVILARGQSRRLGFPKGSARLEADGPSFLAQIEGLYGDLGFRRLVVTLPELDSLYRNLVPPSPGLEWLAHPGGGDTAETLAAAWNHLRDQPGKPRRVWAHPVDLPLVKPGTVELLAQAASRVPDQVVRPVFHGSIGHPVVFPWDVLERICLEMDKFQTQGPMRHALGSVTTLAVDDEGVIKDFDLPESFTRDPGSGSAESS